MPISSNHCHLVEKLAVVSFRERFVPRVFGPTSQIFDRLKCLDALSLAGTELRSEKLIEGFLLAVPSEP
jgi:hypothetical protein